MHVNFLDEIAINVFMRYKILKFVSDPSEKWGDFCCVKWGPRSAEIIATTQIHTVNARTFVRYYKQNVLRCVLSMRVRALFADNKTKLERKCDVSDLTQTDFGIRQNAKEM